MNTKVFLKQLQQFILNNKNDVKPSTLDVNSVPFKIFEDKPDENGLSDEAIVNVLIGYIETNQILKAKELADYLIEHGLPFSDRFFLFNYDNLQGV